MEIDNFNKKPLIADLSTRELLKRQTRLTRFVKPKEKLSKAAKVELKEIEAILQERQKIEKDTKTLYEINRIVKIIENGETPVKNDPDETQEINLSGIL